MADSKISALPASTTPLAGTEVLPIVQSSTTKQVSVANLTAGRDIAATSLTTAAVQATNSGGLALKNSSGTTQLSLGAGGGDNITLSVATNITPANAAVAISPTGTGTVTINPATASTINNTSIGVTTPAAGKFTTLNYSNTTLANYLWTDWAPSDVTGTTTNAPGTGTADTSNYVSLSNSSGTLTVTFTIAGKYLISIISATQHSQTYTYDNLYLNFGGTATIRQPTGAVPCNSGEAALAQNFAISSCYFVSATAAQTLTILPQYRIVGAGTTANHTAGCGVAIQYCGG
jgi:hypothetical protein